MQAKIVQLTLNLVATGVRPPGDLAPYLQESTIDVTLSHAFMMASQSSPAPDDAPVAIERSGLKPTFTPCIVLRTKGLKSLWQVAAGFPLHDKVRAVTLMLALFTVADARRRATRCRNGCSHWWHRDLSDPAVIAELTAESGRGGLRCGGREHESP